MWLGRSAYGVPAAFLKPRSSIARWHVGARRGRSGLACMLGRRSPAVIQKYVAKLPGPPRRFPVSLVLCRGSFSMGSPDLPKGRSRQRVTRDGILLPDGWQEYDSPSKGIYYAHSESGVTQWDIPRGPPTPQQLAQSFREKHGDQIAKLQPGRKVLLRGLITAPQLNGKTGTCEQWDFASGKVRVRLDTGELKAIKPEFLLAQGAPTLKTAKSKPILLGVGQQPREVTSSWSITSKLAFTFAGGVIALSGTHMYTQAAASRQPRLQRNASSDASSAQLPGVDASATPSSSSSASPTAAPPSRHTIVKTDGEYVLTTSGGDACTGNYTYDAATGMISSSGLAVGKFAADTISPQALTAGILDGEAMEELRSIRIIDTEIMAEIQMPSSENAYFVLPSQLNGAEYPSDQSVVTAIEQYKYDNTGGPRGQLAVHTAAGQFVLDNAAHRFRPGGINAVDTILLKAREAGTSFELQNGYLKLPMPVSEDKANMALGLFTDNLHTLRTLSMEGVPACGLTPSKQNFAEATHRVNLVYASAVPVQAYLNHAETVTQSKFHLRVAEAVLFGQYYGALKMAAGKTDQGSKAQVFLMPLGGGVFNNPWESIAWSMSLAVEMLTPEERAKLDIRALTWKGNPMESQKLRSLLMQHKKLLE